MLDKVLKVIVRVVITLGSIWLFTAMAGASVVVR